MVLDRAGFDEGHVRERMAADQTADLGFGALDRPRVLRRTRDGDPLATLIRLFLAGVPVPSTTSAGPSSRWTRPTGASSGLVDSRGTPPAAP